MDLDIAQLLQSYSELSVFNKVALWGSLASIAGFLVAFIARRDSKSQADQDTTVTATSTRASSPDVSRTRGNVTISYGTEPGPYSPPVADCPYSKIDSRLSSTPKGDPAALSEAAAYIVKAVSGTSDACRSSALRAFAKFNNESVEAYNHRHEQEIAQIPFDERAVAAYNQQLAVAGWELGSTEGTFFVQPDENWMRTTFDAIMPTDWREFFLQRSKEMKEEFTHDAVILIPFDEIRKRIIYWEEFVRRHPLFPLRDQVEYMIVNYLAVYLSGTDNSRIYEYPTSREEWDAPKPLRREVRNSYQNFFTVNQESRYSNLIREWFLELRKNQFMVTDALVDSFLEENLTRGGRGIEFPRR